MGLLQELLKSIDEIVLFQRRSEMQAYAHKMRLCACQMTKALPPLCKILSSGSDPALKVVAAVNRSC